MTTLTVLKGVCRDLWVVVSAGEREAGWGGVPAVNVLLGGEPLLPGGGLAVEELLELEELLGGDLVLEMGKPALMQRVDLELEQLALLVGQRLDPFHLVKLGARRL